VINGRRRFICFLLARKSVQPVLVVKPVQHGFLADSESSRQNVSAIARRKAWIAAVRNPWSERRMRTGLVVMAYPFAKEAPKVPLVQRDQIIQALAPDCPHQAFAVALALGARTGVRSKRRPSAPTWRSRAAEKMLSRS
jgi:hypothetical protein